MVQLASLIVLVATLFTNTFSCCSAENVYCVTPTVTSCSSCPHNNHCATLSEYAQEAEVYFTSNTTIVFLPGDHTLDTNITVANTLWQVYILCCAGYTSCKGYIPAYVGHSLRGIPVYTSCKGYISAYVRHTLRGIPGYTSCKGYIPAYVGHTLRGIPGYTSCKGYIPTNVGHTL